jgi:SsrA-binding protein
MDLVVHKTAHRSYHLLDRFEAGIALTGSEVKSLRAKYGSLKEAYIKIHPTYAELVNAHIPLYQAGHPQDQNYQALRSRKLLLRKKEFQQIQLATKAQGFTIVPLRIYLKGKLLKLELSIAQGKKLYDKRNDLKEKSTRRDIERVMKGER